MTDSLLKVLVPYSRFVEGQDRRRCVAAELTRLDQPPTIDGDVLPVPLTWTAADGTRLSIEVHVPSTPATIPHKK